MRRRVRDRCQPNICPSRKRSRKRKPEREGRCENTSGHGSRLPAYGIYGLLDRPGLGQPVVFHLLRSTLKNRKGATPVSRIAPPLPVRCFAGHKARLAPTSRGQVARNKLLSAPD